MRTIDISIDSLGRVTLSDSLLGMVGEHNNTKLCIRSEEGFFSDADFFRMCFGRYETAALYPVDGVIEYLIPGTVTGSTTKSWQLAGYRFDGQTPSLVKKSEVATFALLPSAQPQVELDAALSGTIEEEIQTLSALVEDANVLLEKATTELAQAAGRYVEKEDGKSLSTNDYTDSDKAAVATVANKLNLPLYDVGNANADSLTEPGIYATSYAGPQNFPFISSDAMPLLIVAEAGRMPDMVGGTYDFSAAKTLLQICIGKGGEVYSRYKIAGEGNLSSWSWSAWSTKAVSVTDSLTSTSTTAALSAAQGKALNESKLDKAWQSLADLTLEEGEGASIIRIAMPDAITACGELMLEVEFYTENDKTSQWMPTFYFSDVNQTAYNCWLGGGGTGTVTAGTSYAFTLHATVGDSRLVSTYGQASSYVGENSRTAACTSWSKTSYRRFHSDHPCYLYCKIVSGNSFAAGTKIKLLGR